MTRTFTLGRAVREAKIESELCPSKMGMRQVSGGPAVNAYRDLEGHLMFDIMGAGLMFTGLSLNQAIRLSEVLFV